MCSSIYCTSLATQAEWFAAAELGRIKKLESIHSTISHIDIQNRNGESALFLAAKNNQEKSIKWLLKHGADPHLEHPILGVTPQQWITYHQNHSSSTETKIEPLDSGLHALINQNHPLIYDPLVQDKWISSLLPFQPQKWSNQLTRTILKKSILEVLKTSSQKSTSFLFNKLSIINKKNSIGKTPMDLALDQNNANIVLLLKQNGAVLSSQKNTIKQ